MTICIQEDDVEGSGHELEIAKLSHNLAKDLEMLSAADGEYASRYNDDVISGSGQGQHRGQQVGRREGDSSSSREKLTYEASPDTEVSVPNCSEL
mgnify:FL=1